MRRASLIHVISALLVTVIVAGMYVAWFLMFRAASERSMELSAEIAHIESEDAVIASTKGIAASLDEDEALLASYFVSGDDIVGFLETLEQSGDQLGSLVEVVSVTSGTGGDAGRVILALRIQGSFSAVMRTLGSLEYGPHDMRVQTLTLEAGAGEEGALWSAATTFSVGLLPETP